MSNFNSNQVIKSVITKTIRSFTVYEGDMDVINIIQFWFELNPGIISEIISNKNSGIPYYSQYDNWVLLLLICIHWIYLKVLTRRVIKKYPRCHQYVSRTKWVEFPLILEGRRTVAGSPRLAKTSISCLILGPMIYGQSQITLT